MKYAFFSIEKLIWCTILESVYSFILTSICSDAFFLKKKKKKKEKNYTRALLKRSGPFAYV